MWTARPARSWGNGSVHLNRCIARAWCEFVIYLDFSSGVSLTFFPSFASAAAFSSAFFSSGVLASSSSCWALAIRFSTVCQRLSPTQDPLLTH